MSLKRFLRLRSPLSFRGVWFLCFSGLRGVLIALIFRLVFCILRQRSRRTFKLWNLCYSASCTKDLCCVLIQEYCSVSRNCLIFLSTFAHIHNSPCDAGCRAISVLVEQRAHCGSNRSEPKCNTSHHIRFTGEEHRVSLEPGGSRSKREYKEDVHGDGS